MEKLEFFYYILISSFLHIFVFFIISYTNSSDIIPQPNLKLGAVVSTNLVFFKSPTQSGNNSTSNLTTPQDEGTEIEEVTKFQNSLSYPPLALERGWETECEWEIEIIEGKAVSWKYLRTCSHEIFRTTVEKAFQTWEFPVYLTRKIKIPIRFKIQQQD